MNIFRCISNGQYPFFLWPHHECVNSLFSLYRDHVYNPYIVMSQIWGCFLFLWSIQVMEQSLQISFSLYCCLRFRYILRRLLNFYYCCSYVINDIWISTPFQNSVAHSTFLIFLSIFVSFYSLKGLIFHFALYFVPRIGATLDSVVMNIMRISNSLQICLIFVIYIC